MRVRRAEQQLEAEIRDLETVSVSQTDQQNQQLLELKRQELRSFLHEGAKGALVGAQFTTLQDMDAPTSFFFNLERSVAQRK